MQVTRSRKAGKAPAMNPAGSRCGRIPGELASGETLTVAKLVLAFGISDVLPELLGLAERWGKSMCTAPIATASNMPMGV